MKDCWASVLFNRISQKPYILSRIHRIKGLPWQYFPWIPVNYRHQISVPTGQFDIRTICRLIRWCTSVYIIWWRILAKPKYRFCHFPRWHWLASVQLSILFFKKSSSIFCVPIVFNSAPSKCLSSVTHFLLLLHSLCSFHLKLLSFSVLFYGRSIILEDAELVRDSVHTISDVCHTANSLVHAAAQC